MRRVVAGYSLLLAIKPRPLELDQLGYIVSLLATADDRTLARVHTLLAGRALKLANGRRLGDSDIPVGASTHFVTPGRWGGSLRKRREGSLRIAALRPPDRTRESGHPTE